MLRACELTRLRVRAPRKASFEGVLALAEPALGANARGYRAEFVALVCGA